MSEIEKLSERAIDNHYALYGRNSALPIDERLVPGFVRAMLTALREPSEELQKAGEEAAEWDGRSPYHIWRGMIEHILNQDEGLGHHGVKARDRK
jgi:hypothetical protein